MEGNIGWHGVAPKPEEAEKAKQEIMRNALAREGKSHG
jgi:hypothetical protein